MIQSKLRWSSKSLVTRFENWSFVMNINSIPAQWKGEVIERWCNGSHSGVANNLRTKGVQIKEVLIIKDVLLSIQHFHTMGYNR